jgi:hypothetical protein
MFKNITISTGAIALIIPCAGFFTLADVLSGWYVTLIFLLMNPCMPHRWLIYSV